MSVKPDPIASACVAAAALKWRLAILADCFEQSDPSRAQVVCALHQASEICAALESLESEEDGRDR